MSNIAANTCYWLLWLKYIKLFYSMRSWGLCSHIMILFWEKRARDELFCSKSIRFPSRIKRVKNFAKGNKLGNVSHLSKVMMESGSGRDCSEMQFPFYILMHFASESARPSPEVARSENLGDSPAHTKSLEVIRIFTALPAAGVCGEQQEWFMAGGGGSSKNLQLLGGVICSPAAPSQ